MAELYPDPDPGQSDVFTDGERDILRESLFDNVKDAVNSLDLDRAKDNFFMLDLFGGPKPLEETLPEGMSEAEWTRQQHAGMTEEFGLTPCDCPVCTE